MSAHERRAFLEEERTVICASHGARGWPHLMPLWYVVRDGDVWAWTYARSQKVRNLERDPRATLQVEAGQAYGELRGVMIEADTEIVRDPDAVGALGVALAARYGGGEPGPEVMAVLRAQAPKRVALRFVARRTASWDHRKVDERRQRSNIKDDELMDSEEDQAHALEPTREASGAPAVVRFRVLVAFVGDGRRGTQAGNLTPADAVALARALGVRVPEDGKIRSIDDLPEVAHVFHWAVAAELLRVRGTRIMAGPRAEDLERDPFTAWLTAATTLVEHGLLDGFRSGWRKHYVPFLDGGVPFLLSAILEAGGEAPIAAIEELVWERVASAYGYDRDDGAERRHVDRLVQGIIAQLADLGAAERHDRAVRLTGLGAALAAIGTGLADDGQLE